MQESQFDLPLLIPGQGLKYITMNTSLERLDAAAQISVSGVTEVPPEIGMWLLVGDTLEGAFIGREGNIAMFGEAGWSFPVPKEGGSYGTNQKASTNVSKRDWQARNPAALQSFEFSAPEPMSILSLTVAFR